MSTETRMVVLMSTFNGESFIGAQLESILRQLPANAKINIRDDGSTDRTISIIEALGDSRIVLTRGVNIGFGASFMTLIEQADPDADLILLSDQDDVWFPDKLARASAALQNLMDQPALYCTAQKLVDTDLNPLNDTQPWPRPPAFENALVENIVTGCTAALNQRALRLLKDRISPMAIHFHDWWMYLVISAFGQIIYDPIPSLMYRQHGGNVIGHGAGWLGRQVQMIRFLLKHDWAAILLRQVVLLRLNYTDLLSPHQRHLIDRHFSIKGERASLRLRMLLGSSLWRQKPIHELPLRMLLVAHQIRACLNRSKG